MSNLKDQHSAFLCSNSIHRKLAILEMPIMALEKQSIIYNEVYNIRIEVINWICWKIESK